MRYFGNFWDYNCKYYFDVRYILLNYKMYFGVDSFYFLYIKKIIIIKNYEVIYFVIKCFFYNNFNLFFIILWIVVIVIFGCIFVIRFVKLERDK